MTKGTNSAPIRLALIGCVASSQVALNTLLAIDRSRIDLVGIITRRASSFNSDYCDLSLVARENNIPILFIEDLQTDAQQADWLRKLQVELIFTIGWSRLLPSDILSVPSRGVIGFHPAALPANRGRHPLVWALSLGLNQTASSFFLMGSGIDDGPIISQYEVQIAATDTAKTLYEKILALIPNQITEILDGVIEGTLVPTPQQENGANYWRKRRLDDGQIDWRMSATSIYNLVRAIAKPYPGAHLIFNKQIVKVWRCTVELSLQNNLEPGKVLVVEGREVVIKTGDGAIRIIEHEFTDLPLVGDYL
jgi:methionyl-tRNA formyltransferase